MTRPHRGVAQRYAARKRKKRASGRLFAVASPVRPVPTGAAVASADAPPASSQPETAAPAPARLADSPRPAGRPFSAYAQQYRYVFSDLRRVALVAGSLLAALIVLSFFIR